MRDTLVDIADLMLVYPPMSLGLMPLDERETVVMFTRLLETMMIPQEASLKVQYIIGTELYEQVLEAYWPSDGSEPKLPLFRPMRNQYQNIKLAEIHFICAGVLDLVLTLKNQEVGRVRSHDNGSEAEFELRGDDAKFFTAIRAKHILKAYAALKRSGFTAKEDMVRRLSMNLTPILLPPETVRRAWTV